jgi:hypothetical protein
MDIQEQIKIGQNVCDSLKGMRVCDGVQLLASAIASLGAGMAQERVIESDGQIPERN